MRGAKTWKAGWCSIEGGKSHFPLFVGVPLAELAGARSTSRAAEPVKASAKAQPVKSPSQPRSAVPSPSPIAEVRAAEEPTPVSVVSAAPCLSAVAEEAPTEAAVQSAMRQLLAIVEAARHLRLDVGLRDPVYLEDAPRGRRGRHVREEFVPVLRGGVLRYSSRAMRFGRTPGRWCSVRVGLVFDGLRGVLSWTAGSSPCTATASVLTRRRLFPF